jgi:hypothetical protein
VAELLEHSEEQTEARVLSGSDLLRELRAEDRERILELLNNRSTADVERAALLRQEAIARRAGLPPHERRSGRDRRSGADRRTGGKWTAGDRRSGSDRRSGRDRRSAPVAA